MNNIEMYCISLEPTHKKFIKELGYIPVGLGNNDFKGWMTMIPVIIFQKK